MLDHRGPLAPDYMQHVPPVYKTRVGCGTGMMPILIDKDGRVAVRNKAGVLRWMVPADENDLAESCMIRVV